MPDKLPKGWLKTTLSEVSEVIQGQSPPGYTYNVDGDGMPFFQGKTEFGDLYPTPVKWCSSPTKIAQRGDVLISIRAPVGPTNLCSSEACIGRGLAAIRPLGGIPTRYILYAIRNNVEALISKASGTTFEAISGSDLRSHEILVAPHAEQKRIVAKLEALLSRVAAGEAAAHRALERLNRYRAAVLHAAVTGELTRDWRKTHKPDESGAQLLKRLLQERRVRWEAAELKRLQPASKQLKDDNWKKGYEEPTSPKSEGLPNLPKEWVWTNLSQLKVYSLYGPRFGKSDYAEKGVAVLRTTDIDERGRVSLESCPKLPLTEADYQKYKVELGDLLITRTGSIGTLAVFKDTVRAVPGAYLLHYRLITPALVEMVHTFLNSPKGQKELWERSAGSGRLNLSAPGLESISLPLPPLLEQTEIVRQVELRQKAADRLASTLDHQLARARATRQSLLREAFEGKLVPQDPKDDPASELLDRIRAVREIEAKKPKAKRMPKPKSDATVRPLLDVLRDHKEPMSPEELFRSSGYGFLFSKSDEPQDVVDSFYKELRELTEKPVKVTQTRDTQNQITLRAMP